VVHVANHLGVIIDNVLGSKMASFHQLFDILVIELQVRRRYVQTRVPEHLLQPPDIPAVPHTVDRKRVSESAGMYVFSNDITISLDDRSHLALF